MNTAKKTFSGLGNIPRKFFLGLVLLAGWPSAHSATDPELPGQVPHAANPILPGYFADPSIVQDGGKVYIYATLDPWGGETLGCWESDDWKNWTYRVLNWPTKTACTSPTSKGAKVWAPSVLRGKDGKFHMVVSVGNEVWAGVADHPLGPWKNALANNRPLIPENFRPGFHMIDAELFLDDDGQAYLYWGSGLRWVNGKCWVVKLKADMATFDGEVRDITPKNYFEAPFVVKHGGRYYLTYSSGNTTQRSYAVRYAVGDSPFGPFEEAANSPILVTDEAKGIISPGHHALFTKNGLNFILYHRHSVPFEPPFVGRQTCVDSLVFEADGQIATVVPTHAGPAFIQGRSSSRASLSAGATATASSEARAHTGPARVLDDNYATRWAAAKGARGAWLQLDLGGIKKITMQEVRPEYAWKPQRYMVEASDDGKKWQTVADFTKKPATGSPILIQKPGAARYLRLVFPDDVPGSEISLFEWAVY